MEPPPEDSDLPYVSKLSVILLLCFYPYMVRTYVYALHYTIIALIARLFSFSEKKLLKSEIIVVPLLMASKFEHYSIATIKF